MGWGFGGYIEQYGQRETPLGLDVPGPGKDEQERGEQGTEGPRGTLREKKKDTGEKKTDSARSSSQSCWCAGRP